MINKRTAGDRTEMLQKLLLSLILLLSVGFAAAQNPSDKKTDDKKAEETEKLRKQAVEFLRETQAEVGSMRSLENRISFGAEMASLMWFNDEKEARAMYLGVTSDFKNLLLEFDRQLNEIAIASSGPDEEYQGGMFADYSGRMNIERKFRKALEMRQQIAFSLAEHEPDMALAFYYDSIAGLTSSMIRERSDEGDSNFELQLMTQVAESNAAKAAQFAIKSLDKGFNYQHLELLKKIYAKDQEKGIEFGGAIVSHVKRNKIENSDSFAVGSLLQYGDEISIKPEGKKPVLTNQELRDIAEVMAQAILAEEEGDLGNGYEHLLTKYAPTRAAQIREKNRRKNVGSNSINAMANAANTVAIAANRAANAANSVATVGPPDADAENRAKALEEKIEAERKIMEDVMSLSTKPLPKEHRDKIIAQARKIIAKSPGKDKKITGLSLLAAQVAKAGDKELAAALMKEAESFVSSQPKNYQDFLLTWMLISGYAEVDTNKAFPMLTDTILRLNDTIAAFVKAAEFIDVSGEMIDDGEVQVGQFGGSMLRGLTKELNIAEPTLRSLAKADFAKTKAATNSFDRAEVRVLAKMLVLRTILGDKEKDPDRVDPNIGLVLN